MRRARALEVSVGLFAAAPLLLAASAVAPSVATAKPDRSAIESYAACMTQRHARNVSDVLDRAFDPAFSARLKALPKTGCDLDLSEVSALELRGPLFAAMYRRFAPQAGRSGSNILAAKGWVPRLDVSDPRAGWYAVSNCLAMRFPDASRGLVLAKVGSDDAHRKLQKVAVDLPQCLPVGDQYKINSSMLTDLVSETVYEIDFATQYGDPKRLGSA